MDITSWRETGHAPVTILQLKGDLAAEEALRAKAETAFADGARNLVLDLSQLFAVRVARPSVASRQQQRQPIAPFDHLAR